MFGVGQCKTFQVMTRTKNKKKFVIFDDGLTVAEEDSRTATKKTGGFLKRWRWPKPGETPLKITQGKMDSSKEKSKVRQGSLE